jgi:hypothetical protein
MFLFWLLGLTGESKIVQTELPRVKVDGQGIFFDVAVVNAEAIRRRSLRPLPDVAVVVSDAVF